MCCIMAVTGEQQQWKILRAYMPPFERRGRTNAG